MQRSLVTFGAALVASGVAPGDRVAIWAPNGVEWVVALFGLLQAGATLVPVNTRFKGVEAADILARSRARALVTVTDFLGTDYLAMLAASGVELPDLRTTVVAGGPAPAPAEAWAGFLARATDGGRAEVDRRSAALGPDDPADILFTSGTTGVPKGVVNTHARTLGVATDWVAMTGLRAGDRYLMVNPYFHMFGLKAGILACVAAGATMLPEPVFDPDRVLVANRWLTTIYDPILAMVPRELRGKLEPAEVFHEILEHRWFLSEQAGHEVDLFETARDYIDTVLSKRPNEVVTDTDNPEVLMPPTRSWPGTS